MKKKTPSKRRQVIRKSAAKKKGPTICSNGDCKLRIKGCVGFEACPGYKSK